MTSFICPICNNTLVLKNRSLVCSKNHQFDMAKEGYVNLLPIKSKKSKLPGDNMDMMQARRRFLESGSYQPLANKLVDIFKDRINHSRNTDILDLGCGEGYYTSFLTEYLPDSCSIYALDISKVAVKYASKRYSKVNFCVASAFNVPLPNESLDFIVRNYAPSLDTELKRLIKKNGYLITVTPGPRHLYQLRECIYREVHDHPEKNSAPDGFVEQDRRRLKYTLNLSDTQLVNDLIDMTPFAWKFNKEKREKYLNAESWEIECDFNIEIYKRVK